MSAAESHTPLTATFQLRVSGELVVVRTVGEAHRFIHAHQWIEWMEHAGLRAAALERLEAAADNAIHATSATVAFRKLMAWGLFL